MLLNLENHVCGKILKHRVPALKVDLVVAETGTRCRRVVGGLKLRRHSYRLFTAHQGLVIHYEGERVVTVPLFGELKPITHILDVRVSIVGRSNVGCKIGHRRVTLKLKVGIGHVERGFQLECCFLLLGNEALQIVLHEAHLGGCRVSDQGNNVQFFFW